MKIFTLLHKSTDKGAINQGQWSRIIPTKPLFNHYCVFTVVIMLLLGGFSSRALGITSSVNTADLWVASTYDAGDSVVWSASNVTFKLHNGGNIKLESSDHILIQKGYTYKLEWRVANGKTINVTGVSVRVRSTMNKSYMTVGSVTSGNVGPDVGLGVYTTVNSGTLSLGNNGFVSLRPESSYGSAIFHMDEITVTYTMDGVEKEVTFDSWNDYDHTKTATTDGPFVKSPEDGTTFTMGGDFKRYTKKNDESDTHFFLTNTTTGLFGKSYTGTLSWTQPTGYTIAVEGISINTFSRGKLYIWPNNDTGKEIRIIDNYTNTAGQTVTYVYNLTYTYSNNSTGYLFPGGNKMGVSDQFKFKATSNEVKINTLTVKYTLTPNTYSITLNNETPTTEGSTSVTVTYDSNNQLSITNPEKDGYTLDGWYTSETDGNGSGTKVIDVNGNLQANVTNYTGANGIWKKAANTTLYAKWILNSDKTITLNNQGATTAGTESMTVRFKTNNYSTGSTSISVPAKTGYTFDGYYSASSGGVQVIDAEGNVVADVEGYTDDDKKWINGDEETTLYAHWTGVTYSVRFNANTGSGSMSNQAFTYGTAQNLTANAFEKTCTVTFNANGGSCGIASSTTPFPFLGWATSEGGDVVYANGASVNNLTTTSGATVDLYAKWATVADAIVLPTPTKDGYVFLGWYNSSNVLVGDAGGPYTPTGSETLEAHWVQALTSTVDKSTLLDNFDGDAKSISWSTEHVTFTLAGDGLKKETWLGTTYFYLYATNSKAWQYDLTWTIDSKDAEGNSAYTISVKKITFDIERASGVGTYMTIEGRKSGNLYGGVPSGGISSGTLSKGEDETVTTLIETSDVFYSNIVLNNVTVIYTLEPIINVASEQSVPVTICDENQQLLDLSTCASLADQSGHIALNYSLIGDNADNAHKTLDNKFYADVVDTYRVRASVDARADCHSGKTVEFTINVVPATLELTAPTAGSITYHNALSASILSDDGLAKVGDCIVEGSWAWQNPSYEPTSVGDDQEFNVVFTPDNASYYTNFVTTTTLDVLRAEIIFDGSGSTNDQWINDLDWQDNAKPMSEDIAVIRHDVVITEQVSAYCVRIEGTNTVTIAPTGGLTVGAGGIIGASKNNFFIRAENDANSAYKGQTGYLRISPSYTTMPEVTMELLRQGYTNSGVAGSTVDITGYSTWQYVGCPVKAAGKKVKQVIGGWINSWDEKNHTWVNNRDTLKVYPFRGFANSQDVNSAGAINKFKGTLLDNTNYNVQLACTGETDMSGWNLLANSYSAPIDIKAMLDNCGADVEHAVYIFNTGNTGNIVDTAGTYTTITKALAGTTEAEIMYQGVIPAMQGFFVKANSACTFTFNYANAVWNATYSGASSNKPMRAPERVNNESEKEVISISLEANGKRDKVLLIEQEDYSTDFENGYDAHIMPVGSFNIFTIEGEDDYLAVDATNSINGTRVGVRTGEETAYTMTFNYVSDDAWALYDSETEQTLDINEGLQYTFFAEPNSVVTERFQIVEREAPSITTGVDNVESGVKVHKFIKDNQVYILKNGILYNAVGAIVR